MEDEVRLRCDERHVEARVRAGVGSASYSGNNEDGPDGIEIQREFGWSVEDIHGHR